MTETKTISGKIDPKECELLPDYKLPVLVLAVHDNYSFNDDREWLSIAHKTGGASRNLQYMIGTILQPKPEFTERINMINKYWFKNSQLSITLDEVIEYRKQLNELLDVDCNFSYPKFDQGIYPIDCTKENIEKLVLDEIPDRLDDFIDFKGLFDTLFGLSYRWHFYILGENRED